MYKRETDIFLFLMREAGILQIYGYEGSRHITHLSKGSRHITHLEKGSRHITHLE